MLTSESVVFLDRTGDSYDPMYQWVCDLFPINRSLTGDGVRQTLAYIARLLPGLRIQGVPSGTRCLDWTVPAEWNVEEAYIENSTGRRFADFRTCNLHLLGYSTAIDGTVKGAELKRHLYTRPDLPDAIPYVTSYYQDKWGFCIAHNDFETIDEDADYRVVIKSEHKQGELTFADLVIPGESRSEVLFSTYICHPSMANNELSGPAVAAALARWLISQPRHKYTYRFLFVPETVGTNAYLSQNLDHLKENVIAGYVLTCCGDDNQYGFVPSRQGNTLADRAARACLQNRPKVNYFTFLDRGSDERQYCSPGVDLPVCSVTRSKYREYREYHTSLDNLSFVSQAGLCGTLDLYRDVVTILEANSSPVATIPGEPQLSRRGLYPTDLPPAERDRTVRGILNFLAYSDGEHDLINLLEVTKLTAAELIALTQTLLDQDLIRIQVEAPEKTPRGNTSPIG